MFVRFPIILARPTSLRGSRSPDLWRKVIGRTPGGVFPRTVSPRRGKTKLWALLFLLCFWCDKPWKNTQRGRPGFVLCVCPPMSLLRASHPATQTPALPRCLGGPAPPTRVSAGAATAPAPSVRGWGRHGASSPVCAALPAPSSRLRPRASPCRTRQPAALPEVISPCSPWPACSDGQDAPSGEGFLTSISLGPPG